MQRGVYLRELRRLIPEYGSDNIIYCDESGFEEDVRRDSGWAPKGQKIYSDVKGGKNPRTNLIMGQRKKSKQWLAPILFNGSCEAATVLMWITDYLLKQLTKPSVIIMDHTDKPCNK